MTLQQFGVDFISSCPFDVLLTIITYFDYQWGLFFLSNSDDFAYESSAGINSRYIKLLKVIKLLRFLRTYHQYLQWASRTCGKLIQLTPLNSPLQCTGCVLKSGKTAKVLKAMGRNYQLPIWSNHDDIQAVKHVFIVVALLTYYCEIFIITIFLQKCVKILLLR